MYFFLFVENITLKFTSLGIRIDFKIRIGYLRKSKGSEIERKHEVGTSAEVDMPADIFRGSNQTPV